MYLKIDHPNRPELGTYQWKRSLKAYKEKHQGTYTLSNGENAQKIRATLVDAVEEIIDFNTILDLGLKCKKRVSLPLYIWVKVLKFLGVTLKSLIYLTCDLFPREWRKDSPYVVSGESQMEEYEEEGYWET